MVVRWTSISHACQRRTSQRWFLLLVIASLAVSVEGQSEGYAPTVDDLDPPDEVIDDLYGGGDLGEDEPPEVKREEKEAGQRNRAVVLALEEKSMPTTPAPVLGLTEYTNEWGATVPITPDTDRDEMGNPIEILPAQSTGIRGGNQASMLQQSTSQGSADDPDNDIIPNGMDGSVQQAARQDARLAAQYSQQSRAMSGMPNPKASMMEQGVAPVKGNTPEAIGNILNYELQEPTPPPPPLGGVYCRGGACQYRNPPPLPLGVIIKPFPQIIFPNNRREFCHGLSCIPKLGWPPKYDAGFALLCQRLFEYHGGGYFTSLEDKNGIKDLDDLKQAVIHWCKLRTHPTEHANCPTYAGMFVGANAQLINKPTISGSMEVCNNLHFWMGGMKGAETNLKLRKELLPTGFALTQTEPYGINRFGGGGVGPNSLHGREWRKALEKRGYKFPDTPVPDIARVDQPMAGAPIISLIKEKDETEESVQCRTHHAAAFLQEFGYGAQHGAPVPALKDLHKGLHQKYVLEDLHKGGISAQAPAAAIGIAQAPDGQKVSFAQAPGPAPADDNSDVDSSDPDQPVTAPPPPGWPIPPKKAPPKQRKPPLEVLAELQAGIAEDSSTDQNTGMLESIENVRPDVVDPDEGGVLNDNPPPSDADVLRPFGVHTLQSAPQTLQSFGGNSQPAVQPPAQSPPIALQQNSLGAQVADDKAEMQAEDLLPSAGGDPDETGALNDNPGNSGTPLDSNSPRSFLQKNAVSRKMEKDDQTEKEPDYSSYKEWDPLYRSGSRPKYDQHFACRNGLNKPPQSKVMYQLLPPVPWPIGLPPAEIQGNMLQFCSSEMSEIMAGFPQTADTIVDMVGSWCTWQASMTSWVGRAQELGHPEWNFRTCGGMQYFVAFFLRNELGTPGGLPPGYFCSKFFLEMPALYRVEALIKDAWSGPTGRKLDNERLAVAAPGPGVDKELMRAMQEYAESLFSKMRGQRDAFLDMNGAKMDENSFKQPPTGAPPPMDKPALPDSADFPVFIQRHMQNRTSAKWHHPRPEETPAKTRSSFLGSLFNIGRTWVGGAPTSPQATST